MFIFTMRVYYRSLSLKSAAFVLNLLFFKSLDLCYSYYNVLFQKPCSDCHHKGRMADQIKATVNFYIIQNIL